VEQLMGRLQALDTNTCVKHSSFFASEYVMITKSLTALTNVMSNYSLRGPLK